MRSDHDTTRESSLGAVSHALFMILNLASGDNGKDMSGAADVYSPGYIGACTFAGIRSPLRAWGVGHGRLTIGARAHFNTQGSNCFAMRWMRCHIQRSPPWWGKSHVMREKISWPEASTPESELGY